MSAAGVGRCGDAAPTLVLAGPPTPAIVCELPAGHVGWHREGTCEWGPIDGRQDDEVFCPVCFAGMDSSEHYEKCIVPAERREDELYMARVERAMPLWAELLRIRDDRGNDAAVERLTEVLHEVANEVTS